MSGWDAYVLSARADHGVSDAGDNAEGSDDDSLFCNLDKNVLPDCSDSVSIGISIRLNCESSLGTVLTHINITVKASTSGGAEINTSNG